MHELTLRQCRDAIASRRIGAEQYLRALLDRIAAHDPGPAGLGCFLETFADDALVRARLIDREQGLGRFIGPLAGVPVAVKDNICTLEGRTTCASRILEHYRSPFPAAAVERLTAAGAIVLGKTNMDEFGMGSSTENSAFARTRNPWDRARVPGGSSGGSAAAVAAGFAPAALGSDTGGSVRQPAAFCGVVGVKPTYGRVSRWGLVAYASSLDQIGPITRTVEDAAIILECISGLDHRDATSADVDPPSLTADIDEPVEQLRLGVPRELTGELADKNHPDVRRAFDQAVETFRSLGASIVDVDLPSLRHGIAAYYLIATAEASSNLARFDGVRYGRRADLPSDVPPDHALYELYARSRAQGLGPEVRKRIMLGTYALSAGYYDAYYLTALKARRLVKQDFDRAFAGHGPRPAVHAILMPTAPGPAFQLGEKTTDPLTMYLEDLYTVTANLAGVPALSLPMGHATGTGAPLPLGLQILAPMFDEARLLRIARQFENATSFANKQPIP